MIAISANLVYSIPKFIGSLIFKIFPSLSLNLLIHSIRSKDSFYKGVTLLDFLLIVLSLLLLNT